MRIGLFGGSFNPVHNGHIHLAKSVKDFAMLDKIIFMPSKTSPHKSSNEYVSDEHRLNMLKLAVKDEPDFEISDYELSFDRVSYTVFTVRYLKQLYPNDDIFLLVGSDMLLCFEKWFCYDEILKNVTLIVTSRESDDFYAVNKTAEKLSNIGKVLINQTPPLPISSTKIRKNIMKNNKFTCYLDKNVVQYILLNKLYL